jgi:hypothetical protein
MVVMTVYHESRLYGVYNLANAKTVSIVLWLVLVVEDGSVDSDDSGGHIVTDENVYRAFLDGDSDIRVRDKFTRPPRLALNPVLLVDRVRPAEREIRDVVPDPAPPARRVDCTGTGPPESLRRERPGGAVEGVEVLVVSVNPEEFKRCVSSLRPGVIDFGHRCVELDEVARVSVRPEAEVAALDDYVTVGGVRDDHVTEMTDVGVKITYEKDAHQNSMGLPSLSRRSSWSG